MKITIVKVDADVNSAKFWEAIQTGSTINCRWGRYGASGQTKSFVFSSDSEAIAYIAKKVKEKTKEGYAELKTLDSSTSTPVIDLKSLVRKEIKADGDGAKLLDELVAANVHAITTNSKLTINAAGAICLPSGLGYLTADAVNEARVLLNAVAKGLNKRGKEFKRDVEKYLMLVPQEIARGRGWIDAIFNELDAIKRQEDLLDGLGAAIQNKTADEDGKPTFEVELSVLNDAAEEKRIKNLFESTRQSMHDANRFKLTRIFSCSIGPQKAAYSLCNISNEKELWHGTGVGNLLSILKSGLIVPKTASNGRNFGDGIYFSDQTTKALNYAGGYWAGARYKRAFMWLAKVKMGREYLAKSTYESFPMPNYDSTFARGGYAGVANNEHIVYSTNQVLLTHLCEFNE